jgi:hypothetical protein
MSLKKASKILAVLAASALLVGLASSARADIAYGYAKQTISNVTLSPASGTVSGVGAINTSTLDGATVDGSGISKSDPLDTPQTYFGPSAPPENTFARTATGVLPGGPSFTRGDVLISGLGTANAAGNVVSESLLNGTGPHSETANAALTATVTFTPSATGALTITYSYANDLYVVTTGAGSATASYNFDFTIKDAAGTLVFQYGSTSLSQNTNLALSSPPPVGEIIRSGTDSVTIGTLTGGQNYTLTFTEKTATSVALAAVPEPGPMALTAVACGLTIITGVIRRFRRILKSA